MSDPNLSFDRLLYILTVFEGLSLWKFADFTKKGVQRIEMEACLKRLWNKCGQIGFSKKCFKAVIFCVMSLVFIVGNCLITLLKWSPPLWTVFISLTILWVSRSRNFATFYGEYAPICITVIFYFIAIKSGACILFGLFNVAYMKAYQKVIVNETPATSVISAGNFSSAS